MRSCSGDCRAAPGPRKALLRLIEIELRGGRVERRQELSFGDVLTNGDVDFRQDPAGLEVEF